MAGLKRLCRINTPVLWVGVLIGGGLISLVRTWGKAGGCGLGFCPVFMGKRGRVVVGG